MKTEPIRCWGLTEADTLMAHYHDTEWGVPIHDDRHLFEKIVLDGAQAGLSWRTILNKRENYRQAFDNFDVQKVARYTPNKIEKLMQNEGIVRNRLKINSAVKNAKAFIEIQNEFGSFDAYIWGFVNGTPIKYARTCMADIPATTDLSDTISKELKRRGMSFVGSTIIYAVMQSMGMVNDHLTSCFRYDECS